MSGDWNSQKQCLRLLFGDKEAYLDKFRTAARARPILLGEEFYIQEHTKPLFKKHAILTLQNLYFYHTYMEVLKILKFRDPITLFENYSISDRKPTLLIQDIPANNFVSRSTKIWNLVTPKYKLADFSCNISMVKTRLKKGLLRLQSSNDPITWTTNDFDINKLEISDLSTRIEIA